MSVAVQWKALLWALAPETNVINLQAELHRNLSVELNRQALTLNDDAINTALLTDYGCALEALTSLKVYTDDLARRGELERKQDREKVGIIK